MEKISNTIKTSSNALINSGKTTNLNLPLELGTGEKKVGLIINQTSNHPIVNRNIGIVPTKNPEIPTLQSYQNISEAPDQVILEREEEYEELLISTYYYRSQVICIVEFIQEHIDPEFNEDLNILFSLEMLMGKKIELIDYISKRDSTIIEKFQKWQTDMQHNIFIKVLERALDPEKGYAMRMALDIFEIIVSSLIVTKEESNKNETLNLNNSSKDCTVIEGLNSFINDTIKDLKKIMNEKYFPLLRLFLKFDNYSEKLKKMGEYVGLFKSDVNINSDDIGKIMIDNASENAMMTTFIIGYIIKLKIFIDMLIRIKESHNATLENLDIALQACNICLEYYKQIKPQNITKNTEFIDNFIRNSAFSKDYNEVKSSLNEIEKKLYELSSKAKFSTQNVSGMDKTNQKQKKGKKLIQEKSKQGKNQGKANNTKETLLKPNTDSVQTVIMSHVNVVAKETVDEKINDFIIQAINVQDEAPEKSKIGDATQINIEKKILDEEDLENVEWEVNGLVENLLQIIEKDRKTKLMLKELKAKQKPKEYSESIVIEKKPEVIKLNTKNQRTLDTIFSGKYCHLELFGLEIESLIKALKGRIKYVAKNKIDILWLNGETGKYEVADSYETWHQSDKRGFLTDGYVQRVRHAIRRGVELKAIAEEMIPKS